MRRPLKFFFQLRQINSHADSLTLGVLLLAHLQLHIKMFFNFYANFLCCNNQRISFDRLDDGVFAALRVKQPEIVFRLCREPSAAKNEIRIKSRELVIGFCLLLFCYKDFCVDSKNRFD
jgi:hypothetical protein